MLLSSNRNIHLVYRPTWSWSFCYFVGNLQFYQTNFHNYRHGNNPKFFWLTTDQIWFENFDSEKGSIKLSLFSTPVSEAVHILHTTILRSQAINVYHLRFRFASLADKGR